MHVSVVVPVTQVGSTMIKSPGAAASMAPWIVAEAATCVGALPPMVTVTVSTDCLPLPDVMTSCPHCAVDVEPPGLRFSYCACCWMVQLGTPLGTCTTIVLVFQLLMVAATASNRSIL